MNSIIQLAKSLDREKINYVFTYGKLAEKIAEGAKTVLPEDQVFSFYDKKILIDELKKHTDGQTIILVKASRGMRLEEVVSALQKD